MTIVVNLEITTNLNRGNFDNYELKNFLESKETPKGWLIVGGWGTRGSEQYVEIIFRLPDDYPRYNYSMKEMQDMIFNWVNKHLKELNSTSKSLGKWKNNWEKYDFTFRIKERKEGHMFKSHGKYIYNFYSNIGWKEQEKSSLKM